MIDISNFSERSFIVIGDLMLDEYNIGTVSRISPEAPVPILDFLNITIAAGGAANVAMNLAKLGNKVELAGTIGNDEAGHRLLDMLRKEGIGTDAIISIKGRSTTRKVRFTTQQQELLRVDYESHKEIEQKYCKYLTHKITEILKNNKVDGVLVSDYNKGLFSEFSWAIWESLFTELKNKLIVCGADTKRRYDALKIFAGFDFVKPNLSELYSATGRDITDGNISTACLDYLELCKAKELFVTLGKDGIYYYNGLSGENINTVEVEVRDTIGAGDTVFSGLMYAIANGLCARDAAKLANIAGSVSVEKAGTGLVSRDELFNRVEYINHVQSDYFEPFTVD